MSEWLAWMRDLAPSRPAALVSVLASEGSAPRGAGTRMVLGADGPLGTIGGGRLEYCALDQARAILSQPAGTWRVQDYPLGPLLGQCCGGRVRLLIEHLDPKRLDWLEEAAEERLLVSTLAAGHVARRIGPEGAPAPALPTLTARGERPGEGTRFAEVIGQRRRPLFLFGAGHVGQAIARHAQGLPLRLSWFDSRPAFAGLPGLSILSETALAACLERAPEDAAVLILTHDHGLDYSLVRAALARPRLALVGVIGSQTKRARFLSRLAREGMEQAEQRLTCPIGLPGITGKEPDVIAIAALAQVLQLERP